MPTLNVVNMGGQVVGTIELSEKIFAAEMNEAAVHAVVRAYLLNQRQGTQSALTRAEVSGGGRKPWKQKGTGHARQGSTRAPQWTHGGIVFAPKPRSYRVSINKKVKKIALFSALSAKVAEGELIVVDNIASADYKTKPMVQFLSAIGANGKTLVVLPEADKKVIKSMANIEGVATTPVNAINVYNILKYGKLVMAKDAVAKIEEVYAE
ncbi:MAG: 50S ribosomal protein L4 [Clostridia bacterium]|jgi:large subunit ribosomal protein L4|nr:50S ribosomal protein L4 [Clostridia bacterium]MBR5263232.1 50S ribosomal protein L4 [Clostridia bacterium]MBR6553325.1 50S ribosomal protein L4 [Clostridia bacterium]